MVIALDRRAADDTDKFGSACWIEFTLSSSLFTFRLYRTSYGYIMHCIVDPVRRQTLRRVVRESRLLKSAAGRLNTICKPAVD